MNTERSIRTRSEPHTPCTECTVREHALFKPIKRELLDWKQAYRITQYAVSPRGIIYRQDEEMNESYTVFRGWVMHYKTLINGKRQVLRVSLPGDFIGYQANQKSKAIHTAIALTECVLCVFPKNSVDEMVVKHPELAQRLMQIHMRDMAQCQERLSSVGQKTAKQRIATFLLDLYTRTRDRTAIDGNVIPFPLTQEEVADAVGITPVHVSRVTSELRNEGLLEYSHRLLTIHNILALAKVAGVNLNAPQPPNERE